MKPKKPHAAKDPPSKSKLRSGLLGSAAEQRRDLDAAIKRYAETLRRLAE
jgi:hypothetical protein